MGLIKELFHSRKMILNLAKNDFKNRFAGSYLGIVWAFVQPIVSVLIYWFIFGQNLKPTVVTSTDVPFLLTLIAGICPWFFFNEALNSSANCFVEYTYIVKKVVFKISILPMVKIISAFFVHIFFIVLVILVFSLHGYMPTLYYLQAIYYSFCVFCLSLSISYFIGSITVFFKDMSQIVNIVLQFGMWLTPIMYELDYFSETVGKILKLNPMYYVVNGYKDSFIRNIGFWHHYKQTAYFWIVVCVLFVLGGYVYKKLKPHFADVL